MSDIVEFLTAQIDEDERVAREAARGGRWRYTRVLREVAAKRAILERHQRCDEIGFNRYCDTDGDDYPCPGEEWAL